MIEVLLEAIRLVAQANRTAEDLAAVMGCSLEHARDAIVRCAAGEQRIGFHRPPVEPLEPFGITSSDPPELRRQAEILAGRFV